jgi:hypothetical protein
MGTQDFISAITGGLSQSDRLIRLDTKLGPNKLVPQRVVGRSRLGRHFEFTVDVAHDVLLVLDKRRYYVSWIKVLRSIKPLLNKRRILLMRWLKFHDYTRIEQLDDVVTGADFGT